MTTKADEILASGLVHLRRRIEKNVEASLSNCLSQKHKGEAYSSTTISHPKKVIALEVLERFRNLVFNGRAANEAYIEYERSCKQEDCEPLSRDTYDATLSLFFDNLADEFDSDDVVRLP